MSDEKIKSLEVEQKRLWKLYKDVDEDWLKDNLIERMAKIQQEMKAAHAEAERKNADVDALDVILQEVVRLKGEADAGEREIKRQKIQAINKYLDD